MLYGYKNALEICSMMKTADELQYVVKKTTKYLYHITFKASHMRSSWLGRWCCVVHIALFI